jgi:hypothetical protein
MSLVIPMGDGWLAPDESAGGEFAAGRGLSGVEIITAEARRFGIK